MEKYETKTREESWWFNQGSPLSIRHYTDRERMRERETSERLGVGERENKRR